MRRLTYIIVLMVLHQIVYGQDYLTIGNAAYNVGDYTIAIHNYSQYPGLAGDAEILEKRGNAYFHLNKLKDCLLYTSPSPRDRTRSRMPSSA